MVNKDFTRKVTHKDYKNTNKLKKYYHRVVKKIYEKPKIYKNTIFSKGDYILVNDNFIVKKTGSMATPQVFGGGALVLALALLFIPTSDPLGKAEWFIIYLCGFLFVFFVIYGFSMPKKEHILNRKDGLITMTGFLWQKNITMEFKKVEFAYSTGGDNLVGGFQLQTIRPNKLRTFDMFSIVGAECYEQMSFITWYMDKNRPLPPNTALDKYRQQDFERRKAEGFPKPLYPSNIPTPEATPEQQAERERIGGW